MIFRDYDEVAVVNPDLDQKYYGATGWIVLVEDNYYMVIFDNKDLGATWCRQDDMVLVYREEITNNKLPN